MSYLSFAILGLASGVIYIGLAGGLLVIYRSTGVLNFAQGAMAAWGAYVYEAMRTTGRLVLPVGSIQVTSGPAPLALSLVVGIVCAAALAWIVQALVFRPLGRASALASVVASVAVMISLEALLSLRFSAIQIVAPSVLPTSSFRIGSLTVAWLDPLVAVIAVGFMVLLWAYFRFSTVGMASRASASNAAGITLMGFSPARLTGVSWTLAGVVSSLLVTLAAPATGLDPSTYTLYVVPALAVLLVARLRSLGALTAAGLGLGIFQSLISLLSSKPWWPSWAQNGLQDAVPFVIVILILLLFGRRLPARGALGSASLPTVRRPRLRMSRVIVAIAIGAAALLLTSGTDRFGVITSMALTLLALSYVVITGFVGQISLAQVSFAGVAGFTLSKIMTEFGVPFPLSLLAAAAVAAGIGLLVAVPAFRVRGSQFAVVTVAAAVVIQDFVFGNPSFTPVSGLTVPAPRLFGLDLSIRSGSDVATLRFGFLVLVILAIAAIAFTLIARGETGRAFLAVRSNERAAASVGLSVRRVKLVAFGLSGLLAGLAGGLIGFSQGQLSFESFSIFVGLEILAVAYLGGITTVGGAVIAGALGPLGIVYVLLNNHIQFGKYYQLIAGIGLVVTAVGNPDGLAGKLPAELRRLRGRLRGRAPAPASVAPAGTSIDELPSPSATGTEVRSDAG